MSALHAKLSASGSERWLRCSGSVKAEDGIIERGSSFAAEGTAAHAVAEHCLFEGVSPDSLIGQTFEGYEVTNYMAEFVQSYVDYVKQFSGHHMYEVRVDFSPWVREGFGTCDAMIIQDDGVLRVIDLKYGQGIMVDAEQNTQAMLYALGAYEDYAHIYDINVIKITIHQPRLDHVSEWEISVSDLLEWGEYVKRKAEECFKDDAPRTPGEKQCQWCKAKATCPALKSLTEQTLITMFDDLTPTTIKPADTLSDKQLRFALDNKKLIGGWLDAVEGLVVERLESGVSFEGFKIVEGRSLRKWGDEKDAAELLTKDYTDEQLYKKSFISVTQAEKLLGKKNIKQLEGLIVKPSGKPTLAKHDDKRPAININKDDFDAC